MMFRSTRSSWATAVLVATVLGTVGAATVSAQTVNWLDPLAYAKPAPVRINEPNEATVTNKYWIDLSNGSGTTCSQSAPCKSFDDVLGKNGTRGGPAILYVKGTGGMSWYTDTIYGSGNTDCRTPTCDTWILIRNWPAGSPGCSAECTATISGNSNMNSPSGVHHIMFDGGPNLKIRFNSDAGAGTYANHIIASNVIVYRTQTFCTGANKQLGWAVGDTSVASNVYFINNEFYGCAATGDQASAVYVGPGDGGGYTNFVFQNNVVRDWFGEGIEINPRVTSSGATIIGNAFHNIGKGTCSTPWMCRPAITMSIQSGGGNNSTVIANNLIWDISASCIWARGGGSPAAMIVNNTCYDYGKGSSGSNVDPEGISTYVNGGTATIRNNIIYAPNGTNPFDSSNFTASNNLCASGKSCGSSKQNWSSNSVQSTDPTSPTFLNIGGASEARNTGFSMSTVTTTTYDGGARPQETIYDIGAFEYGSGSTPPPPPPAAPNNLRVIK